MSDDLAARLDALEAERQKLSRNDPAHPDGLVSAKPFRRALGIIMELDDLARQGVAERDEARAQLKEDTDRSTLFDNWKRAEARYNALAEAAQKVQRARDIHLEFGAERTADLIDLLIAVDNLHAALSQSEEGA